jgi:hypothetical protein
VLGEERDVSAAHKSAGNGLAELCCGRRLAPLLGRHAHELEQFEQRFRS